MPIWEPIKGKVKEEEVLMTDLTSEVLAALVCATDERKRAALRVLRGTGGTMSGEISEGMRVGAQAAAEHLGITMRELKELRYQRRIAYYRIGHRTISYAVADLNGFLAKCRVAPAGEAIGAGGKR